MQFHAGFAPARAVVAQQLAKTALGIAEFTRLAVIDGVEFDGPVALSEGRHRIVLRIRTRKFMGATALQMQLQFAEIGLGNHNGILRERQLSAAFFVGLRQEHSVPLRAAGGDVVDVQHQVRKAFVKNARLHREGDLRSDQIRFDGAQRAQRQRREPQRDRQRQRETRERQHSHREQNAPAPDAQRGEGNNFAVRGHTSQSQEHANENGHRYREGKNSGKHAQKQVQNLRAITAMTHEQFHQPD